MNALGRAALPVAPSRLGFGCASLGSRVAAADGLNALAAAFDAGVNWFDVAPAYGAGEAETLLGRFLRGRRDRAFVVTKVGMAPPRRLGALRLAYALGRPLAARATALRSGFRSLAVTRNRHMPLTAALIERSIGESLQSARRRLRRRLRPPRSRPGRCRARRRPRRAHARARTRTGARRRRRRRL